MKKCKYCGKKLNDNFEFCNSKCENCYEKMMDKDSHKIKYFTLGIILAEFTSEKIGDMSTEMVKEFFYAISYSCGMNLHIKVLTGGNSHHVAEAMFKSFAKALDQAVSFDPRITDVLSTKGSLA